MARARSARVPLFPPEEILTMKLWIIGAFVLALGVCVVQPALAQRPNREEIIKKFDKDGDGKLNEDERAEARKAWQARSGGGRWAEIIKKYDKDGDGKLSDEEKAEAKKARRARAGDRRAEFMKKHDTDGDGQLSDEEQAAARKAMAERRGGGEGRGGRRAEIIKKFDKDGDGKLSDEERAEARKAWQARCNLRRPRTPADGEGYSRG